jgi:hypothetical protein
MRSDDALRPLRVGHAVAVGHRGAASLGDLVDHLLGNASVRTLSVRRATQVVDHNLAALGGGQQCDLPADAAPGAGHHHDLALQASPSRHPGLPVALLGRRTVAPRLHAVNCAGPAAPARLPIHR